MILIVVFKVFILMALGTPNGLVASDYPVSQHDLVLLDCWTRTLFILRMGRDYVPIFRF